MNSDSIVLDQNWPGQNRWENRNVCRKLIMLQYICCFRDLILLWDPQQIEWKAFYLVPLNHKHSILTSNPNNIYGLTMLSFAFYEHFLLENFLWCIKINKSSRSITWAKTVKRLCKMDQKFLFELGFFYTFLYQIVSKKC